MSAQLHMWGRPFTALSLQPLPIWYLCLRPLAVFRLSNPWSSSFQFSESARLSVYSPPRNSPKARGKELLEIIPFVYILGTICYSLPVSSVLKIIVHFLIIVLGEMLYLVSIIPFCLEVELLSGNFLINRLHTSRKKKSFNTLQSRRSQETYDYI